MTLFSSKPSGILRTILWLPIYLYKFHLGWLFGHRLLLLMHRGRKTGRVRHTVLEVLRYDAFTRESFVLSGWGKSAQWFRNIEEAPALAVRIGGQKFEPVQRFLDRDEAALFLEEWQRRHPIEARIFRKQFELPSKPSREALRDFVASHPVISFRPKSQSKSKSNKPFSADAEAQTGA